MPVYARTFYGFPGRWNIADPSLANVTLLHVARAGVSHVETFNETASDLQYIYSSFGGGITFDQDNPFRLDINGGHPVYRQLERILVIWKV